MNRWIPIAIALCAVMVTTAVAEAQISTGITVNYTVPRGDFADSSDPGFGAAGEVCVGLPLLPIRIGGHIGFNTFKENDGSTSGDTTVLEVMPCIKYQIGLPMEIVAFWGQFGMGVFNWKNDVSDGTDMGLSFAVGASAKVTPLMSVMIMPTYNIIMAEDDNITYGTVNVGLRF